MCPLHVQERGPALSEVVRLESDTSRVTEENASSTSTMAGTGIDGEELGIELARVVNDVKVRQLPGHVSDFWGFIILSCHCRQ